MKRSLATKATALACATALASCTYTKTFGYTPQYDFQFQVTGEDPEAAPVEARQLLAAAKTVGFYPPDRCVNTTDKAETEKQFRANCGVLLSYLERSAEKAGYEVVSWVNLRATENTRAIDYARQAKVDVLFEINEIAADDLGANDVVVNRSLAFFDRTDHGDVPFTASPNVTQRCSQWSDSHDKAPDVPAKLVAIDIKAVSVADGRSRWHYRKSEVKRLDDAGKPASERFVGRSEPSKGGQVLAGIGFASIVTMGIMALIDESQSATADPITGVTNEKVFGSIPFYGMGAGAALMAGGIALMVVQSQKGPTPDSMMCLQVHVPVDGLYEGGDPQKVRTGRADKMWQEKVIHESVQQFVDLIVDVKLHPPPMPPPAAAQPAPAAPTPAPAPAPPPAKP